MFERINSNIIVAFCTGAALIAFAFYQRYGGPVAVSEEAFYVTAAIICLLPVAYALIRRRSCQNKASNQRIA